MNGNISRLVAVAALAITVAPLQAQRISADEIVVRHLEARGGAQRLNALETVVYRNGTYHEGDYTGSGRAFMAMARPNFKIVGDPADTASDFSEGYDGGAWEFYRSPGFVVRTVGAANAAIRHNLDPEGPFSDYRSKGSRIERIGDASIGGRSAYGMALTLRDGVRTEYFFDGQTFLLIATRRAAPIHAFGAPVSTEERFADYRAVDGILFPFMATEVEIATGKELSSMRWGAIEVNRKLPRDWFSPPSFVRTPLQEFLEHLYYERADTSALQWTYFAFRRAHPEADTRAGVEAIGYQMLKMADYAGGIVVLSMNAADYPKSSTSAFGLGRAYNTAGDIPRARKAFERALQLDPKNKRAADALGLLLRR
jgi:hypothetical protein